YDDTILFEFLILETFQAGLSWITILRKRENFRNAFDNFDYKKISRYKEEKIQELMNDAGIIRNQLKIRAAVSNANAFIQVQKEFGSFSNYIWTFTGRKPVDHHPKTLTVVPSTSPLSDQISNDLKGRGCRCGGCTTGYRHMQAAGRVNDHVTDCWSSMR